MIPLEDPEGHRWVSPGEFDCHNCRCCTVRLCRQAADQGVSCSWLCPPQEGVFDVSGCPCTRRVNDPAKRDLNTYPTPEQFD